MAKPAKQEMPVKRALGVLRRFMDEYAGVFEPTRDEIEAMRVIVRAV